MSILYQNVRGLNTKLPEVYRNSVGCGYDIVVFTETWLSSDVFDSEVFCNEFNVYRRDRYGVTGKGKRGGGVLISVHSSILSDCVMFSENIDVEFICVRLSFRDLCIYITCSYIPPGSCIGVYLEHASLIQDVVGRLSVNDIILIMGDFNLPRVSWTLCPDICRLMPLSSSNEMDKFFDILFESCLIQFNNIPNMCNRFLDLVFSNSPNISVSRSTPFVCPEDGYHPTLLISFDVIDCLAENCLETDSVRLFDFNKTNYDLLRNCFDFAHWEGSDMGLDGCISNFYEILFSGFSVAVPLKKSKPVLTGPVWFTSELRRLRNVKSRLFKRYKENGSSISYTKYSVVRNKYSVLNSKCYSDYLYRMRNKFRVNPKSFYGFVNSKRKVSGFPSSMNFEGVESSSVAGISDLFAEFFQGTYSVSSGLSSSYPYRLELFNIVSNVTINESEVFNGLVNLKFSHLPGPDGVPSSILKSCANELCIPLTKIFNDSLYVGVFPSRWKESFIIPLHKSGNRRSVDNYRGIAKLSVIPKLFEKIVTNRLIHMLGNFISPLQHGFVRGRSTTTNLLELTGHVFNGFSNGCQTDVIYTDFSKAFDTISHELLLYKLDAFGFPPGLLSWISSYLKDRTQRVLFRNHTSRKIFVTSGVPQGSHLGPILFVLYLNDLPSIIDVSRVLMYADDVKLFLSLSSVFDCNLLQNDLRKLSDWCCMNMMSLNLKKCKKLSFYRSKPIRFDYFIGTYMLENVESFTDLGVLLDHRLSFNLHVNSCVNKAKSLLGFMKRWSKEFNDPYVTKSLYMSLVRPTLEYASVVWSPNYGCYIDIIESVQKQFLLFALRGLGWNVNERLPSYEHRLQLIDLPTLRKRRLMLGVTFIVKLINGKIDSRFLLGNIDFKIPVRTTRNYTPISMSICKYNYEEFNPFRCLCTQYNELYHLFSFSDPIYKIKQFLLREL